MCEWMLMKTSASSSAPTPRIKAYSKACSFVLSSIIRLPFVRRPKPDRITPGCRHGHPAGASTHQRQISFFHGRSGSGLLTCSAAVRRLLAAPERRIPVSSTQRLGASPARPDQHAIAVDAVARRVARAATAVAGRQLDGGAPQRTGPGPGARAPHVIARIGLRRTCMSEPSERERADGDDGGKASHPCLPIRYSHDGRCRLIHACTSTVSSLPYPADEQGESG